MGILFYENCSIFVIEIIYLYLHFKKVSAEEGVHGLMNHPLSVFIRFVTWPSSSKDLLWAFLFLGVNSEIAPKQIIFYAPNGNHIWMKVPFPSVDSIS